jgi:spore maturation protein CgeB
VKIVYSFNKRGFEAEYWQREIEAASNDRYQFLTFNHNNYLDPQFYRRAQLLDNLYFDNHPGLLRMYADLQTLISREQPKALIVDNCFPYHPDFLRSLGIYKVMRTTDGPMAAYDRDFAYLHAYDHVLYHGPAYSRDMGMEEKLRYCGAKRVSFWPHGSFDALRDPAKTELNILSKKRDIDVVFVGALEVNKMPLLAAVKKAFRGRFRLYGLSNLKRNVYFNLKYGFPGWVTALPFEHYVRLYQRAKIGINLHNRGDYTIGSYRLFDLPANGVMQISDGGQYLEQFFSVGKEVVSYHDVEELIDKISYYLGHEEERKEIALKGFRRIQRDYKIRDLLNKAGDLIRQGIESKLLDNTVMEGKPGFHTNSRSVLPFTKGDAYKAVDA